MPSQAETLDKEALINRARQVAVELRRSENYYDQIAGAGTLVELGDKDALQFIADNLSHTDWVVLRSAIDTLLSVQHPAGVDVILSGRGYDKRHGISKVPNRIAYL